MPSEQRLHPATLLFDLAKHLKAFAFPAVLVVLGMSQSSGGPGGMFGRMPDGWELWLLVLFVPASAVSIARYVSFRLIFAERELVIRSGILFRNERHIPFSRIQNVDAVQNLFHQFFNVVEVKIETGGGAEEEARLSVLPYSALETIRVQVFSDRTPSEAPAVDRPLVHLNPRELALFGFLENKGMVLIGAAFGVAWSSGVAGVISEALFGRSQLFGREFYREVAGVAGSPLTLFAISMAFLAFGFFLLFVRIVSVVWAFVRLYNFRLTRTGEDLRSEYGLFTKVATTVPIRRVQTITISTGPLHRWLERTTVQVTTAGGSGEESATKGREWLAPLLHTQALPSLLQHIVPGFDINGVTWQPIHRRAFARAVKPMFAVALVPTTVATFTLGWGAIFFAMLMLIWPIVAARIYVNNLGWAEHDDVVMMRSGWLWQTTTLARVNKIQAVTMSASPFDRRAAMAAVRVDTAGAGELSHRVAIPYLDQAIATALTRRLSAAAANTAFRW